MRALERYSLLLIGLIALGVAHPICNWMFRCGCVFASAAHCNVHNPAGPRCPWCAAGWPFAVAVLGWLLAAAAGAGIARRLFGRRAATTLAGASLGLAIGVVASGALTIALTGYPYFF